MSKLSEEDARRLLFAEFLNQNGVDTGIDVEETIVKLTAGESMEEKLEECCECASISTKRMYIILLTVQEKLLQNTIDKKEIISLLSSLEHDVMLLNDLDNSIECDLFK